MILTEHSRNEVDNFYNLFGNLVDDVTVTQYNERGGKINDLTIEQRDKLKSYFLLILLGGFTLFLILIFSKSHRCINSGCAQWFQR